MEQTTNSNNMAIPDTIRVKYSEKCFYKKYAYKVELVVADEQVGNYLRYTAWYRSWEDRQQVYRDRIALQLKIATFLENKFPEMENLKCRGEGIRLCLYLDSKEVVDSIINEFAEDIREVTIPLSNKHETLIVSDKRIRVRKHLFLKQFKYKVYLKGYNLDLNDRDEVYDWFLETLGSEGNGRYQLNHRLHDYCTGKSALKKWQFYGTTVAIYLNDEADIMITQLRFNNLYDYCEEAVLISDL